MFVVQGISDSLAGHYRKLIRDGVHKSGRQVTEAEKTHMQGILNARKVPPRYQQLQVVQQTQAEEQRAQAAVQQTLAKEQRSQAAQHQRIHDWSKTVDTAHSALEQRVGMIEMKLEQKKPRKATTKKGSASTASTATASTATAPVKQTPEEKAAANKKAAAAKAATRKDEKERQKREKDLEKAIDMKKKWNDKAVALTAELKTLKNETAKAKL
jgi:hypothetical protein